jgi:hypothetical protein
MGFGSLLGGLAGSLRSKFFPIPGIDGEKLGSVLGGLTGFKNGGAVGGKKGKARAILAHGGEYVLPANAKPTKGQRAIVARNKKRGSKRK